MDLRIFFWPIVASSCRWQSIEAVAFFLRAELLILQLLNSCNS
jgi:hypothetical protein